MADSSEFTHHESCPNCGSSDALARYTDGHGHCFSCGHRVKGAGTPTTSPRAKMTTDFEPIVGEYQALSKRGLSEETCKNFGYTVGKNRSGQVVQCAPYLQRPSGLCGGS